MLNKDRTLNKLQHVPQLLLSWSWSYGSWIYNSLFNQCLSQL